MRSFTVKENQIDTDSQTSCNFKLGLNNLVFKFEEAENLRELSSRFWLALSRFTLVRSRFWLDFRVGVAGGVALAGPVVKFLKIKKKYVY